jgi:two-component system OmpR family response regulator
MKILGIDDNKDITELLDTVLNGSGHEFTYARNGKQGLQMIRDNQYDLILLDLAMPEFSGLDVIESLRKEGIISKQKVALFTASSLLDTDIEELCKKGIIACIKKPIDVDVLLEKIEELASH